MWIAVVPACNEALAIGTVVKNIFSSPVDLLLLIANGCSDQTCAEALQAAQGGKIRIGHFSQPLGIDIPKAVGASLALQYRPRGIIFVDGDMRGPIQPVLADLIKAIEGGLALALTNCYPNAQGQSELAREVLQAREALNKRLGLFPRLAAATPSHGPHAFNTALLRQLDLRNLAVPPKALAQAALLQAAIGIGAVIPHSLLGSPSRSALHGEKIAQTIIGDCREALTLLESGLPCSGETEAWPIGYRPSRRFDILDRILETTIYV